MISNAMDGDGKLTAPQVSRKLKQLGLYIPRKRSGANLLKRDEDLNDSNINNPSDSDDETLLSLMNRLFMFLSECQSFFFWVLDSISSLLVSLLAYFSMFGHALLS